MAAQEELSEHGGVAGLMAGKMAFYDLDGTLVSSNVVSQYLWFARNHPGPGSRWRMTRALVRAPQWLALEMRSRRRFNEVFFREYEGLRQEWMIANAGRMFEQVLRPAIFPGAEALVKRDRDEGFRTVLVTGSLDFAVQPLIRHFGFDEAVTNRLEFRGGVATGKLLEPVLAGPEKVEAIWGLCAREGADAGECRAYSDSLSDAPMLEAVGHPRATNPNKKLARLASERGWPVVRLK